jgi:hypothetical protein
MSALYLLSSPPLRYNEDENKFDFKSAEEIIEVFIFIWFMNFYEIFKNVLNFFKNIQF